MRRKIFNQSNWTTTNLDEETKQYIFGEINNEPSQTIPNQTMSLQDMVNQFTITSVWPKTPMAEQFDAETPLPDIQKMDKMEIAELQLNIKQDIANHQTDLKEIQNTIQIQKDKQKEIKDIPQTPPEKE